MQLDSKNSQGKPGTNFSIGDDLFSVGFDSKPPKQAGPDLLGEWGEGFKSEVPLNPVHPPLATLPAARQSDDASSSDPFADFGNIKNQGPPTAFPSNHKVTSPSQQRKPFGGQNWGQSPPKSQPRSNGEIPKKPAQTFTQSKSKPNYTPTYSTAAGGKSVFGEYGLRTSHSK